MGIDGTDLSVHTDKITEWSNFDKGVYLANACVRFPDPKSANAKSKRAKERLLTLGGVEKEVRLHQLIGKHIQVWCTQLNRWDAGAIVGQEALETVYSGPDHWPKSLHCPCGELLRASFLIG